MARAGGLGDTDLTDLLADCALVAPGENHFQSIPEASEATWWTAASWEQETPVRPACPSVATKGAARLWIDPVLRDLYQAAADAGLRDDDVAFVAHIDG